MSPYPLLQSVAESGSGVFVVGSSRGGSAELTPERLTTRPASFPSSGQTHGFPFLRARRTADSPPAPPAAVETPAATRPTTTGRRTSGNMTTVRCASAASYAAAVEQLRTEKRPSRAPSLAPGQWLPEDDGIDSLSHSVVGLIKEKRFDEALAVCERLRTEDPDVHDWLERSASVHEARGDLPLALDFYRRHVAFITAPERRDGYDEELIAIFQEKAAKLEGRLATSGPTPNVRGDNASTIIALLNTFGSPPRAWGRRSKTTLTAFWSTVHPHVRGDDARHLPNPYSSPGSPPRAWGRPGPRRVEGSAGRFTPTCVGTTASTGRSPAPASVHPHVRGDD